MAELLVVGAHEGLRVGNHFQDLKELIKAGAARRRQVRRKNLTWFQAPHSLEDAAVALAVDEVTPGRVRRRQPAIPAESTSVGTSAASWTGSGRIAPKASTENKAPVLSSMKPVDMGLS